MAAESWAYIVPPPSISFKIHSIGDLYVDLAHCTKNTEGVTYLRENINLMG